MWEEAEGFLVKDKYIGVLVKKYGHCKIKPRPKRFYFEDLVDSIIQQQLSMKAAASIFNRVKEKISDNYDSGQPNKHKWRAEKTFNIKVTPEKILALSDKDLRECGLSGAKVVYVKDLSEKIMSKKLLINQLGKLSDDEIMRKLVEVKGVGTWTVHMFLMFTLARPDIFPTGDLGLRNAFKKIIGKDLDIKEIDKFALRWKPWRTVASWYLWRSLGN
jgi:DNA-3-methyladenine glycosylase II